MSTSNTKKVLYIAVSSETGGVPRHIAYALEKAKSFGFAVTVACPSDGAYAETFRKLSAEYIDLPLKPYSLKSLFLLNRYVRKNGIFLVHSHGKGAGMYARPLKFLNPGLKVVHTFHGIYVEKYSKVFRTVYLFIERELKRFTDAFVCVSESERKEALRLDIAVSEHTFVVNNGVDVSVFHPHSVDKAGYRKQFGIPEGTYVIGCVARFDVDKGHEYLIPAFQQFVKGHPDAYLILVGDGAVKEKVAEQVRESGLKDKVVFAGIRNDIPDILQLFDVFVSSSLKEGMPYTLIEAMASGVPIVATDVVGNRDVVIDGITGRLVAAKNPDAIYEGLQKTVSNRTEAEKFAMNGISYVKKEFTVDKSVERLFGIYQALAGDRS